MKKLYKEQKHSLYEIQNKINVSKITLYNYANKKRKIEEKETQQKEFIEYLEKRYKDITDVIGSYGSNTDMLYGKKDMIKEILQKYKEIIGDDKE